MLKVKHNHYYNSNQPVQYWQSSIYLSWDIFWFLDRVKILVLCWLGPLIESTDPFEWFFNFMIFYSLYVATQWAGVSLTGDDPHMTVGYNLWPGTMVCQQVDPGEGGVSLRMFSCVLKILNENGEFNIHKLIIRIHTFDRSWLCQCYCIPWYQLETTPPSEHSTKHWFNKEEACQMGPIVSPLCSVCLWNVRSLWWKPFT